MWYAASLLFEGMHPGQPRSENLWEEQILLVNASSEDEARQQAERLGKDAEHSYVSATNEPVHWLFRKIDRMQEIEAATLESGTEIFSRFLRASEVQSLLGPISDRDSANHVLTVSE